ncbi:methyltransferase family protein [Dokdonia sp. R86516]|uniref:methyltransferase family protein n=1 Tax=Dokdonia sp. R86516 TaxID=3093856 RepID=UPI0037C7817F
MFSVLRNPMYTGIILLFLPTILKAHSALMWIYYVLLVTVLILKIYREEIFLQEKFGEVYSLYKARTWRILPYIF